MVMTAPQRPGWRRGPSATWSRLRPTPTDVLEQYGLPSKGETRLVERSKREVAITKKKAKSGLIVRRSKRMYFRECVVVDENVVIKSMDEAK